MAKGGGPNIVIVVMDCVRAQNLPIYGYAKRTAPRLTEFAQTGLRFDNAISVAEQTLSSTGGLFTGTYPSSHGLFVTGETLDRGASTLAEALSAAGYETHCINCNNPYISDFSELDRGFDHSTVASPWLRRWWVARRRKRLATSSPDGGAEALEAPEGYVPEKDESPSPKTNSRRAKRLRWALTRLFDGGAKIALNKARQILAAHSGRPKFVYVHLMETHMYYHPPPRHTHLFLPDTQGRDLWNVNQNPLTFASGETPMDQLDFEIVEGLYNGTIHYSDAVFGRFFDRLQAAGLLDNTVLVLTADHGESFGEHGFLGHGQCVYDTVIRIPLVLWGPVVESRHRGSAISQVVQNIDLTASCLEWAGCTEHPMTKQVQGTPLPVAPDAARTREVAFAQTVQVFEREKIALKKQLGLFEHAAVAVRNETHKLIWNATEPDEFYDLTEDPNETKNVIDDHPELVEGLRGHLHEVLPQFEQARDTALQRFREGEFEEVDPVVEERLRDLGYIE